MNNGQNKRIINVAAGILQQSDGQILFASRPADKPWAGYWEFPGGKLEAGETAEAALARELQEELGIHIQNCRPWLTLRHDYDTASVVLHCFVVDAWQNEPEPREGQQLRWQDPGHVTIGPLLPANQRLLAAFNLPAVIGISPASGEPAEFLAQAKRALRRGLRFIHLRRDNADELAWLAGQLAPVVRDCHARLVINGDVDLARISYADGVQLKAGQLADMIRRPDVALVGASCHNAHELALAAQLGCDYALLSPVLPTRSHPDTPALGWEVFARLIQDTPIPVYALGGMQADLLEIARAHGAHGIAMLGSAWQ